MSSDAISNIGFPTTPQPFPQRSASSTVRIDDIEECERTCKGPEWRAELRGWVDDCKTKLEKGQTWLERILPNTRLQHALDDFGNKIHELLKKARDFHAWANDNGMGAWYEKLSIFLLKLPLSTVSNIIQLVYGIVKCVSYSFVHPLKAFLEIPKYLLEMIFALSMPETYTKLGAGIIGASFAHVAITSGFGLHAYIGLGIGGAMLVFGLTWGAVETLAVEKKAQAVAATFWEHIKIVPESMIVGFLVGVTFGAIQIGLEKLTSGHAVVANPDLPAAKKYIDQPYIPKKMPPTDTE